MTGAEKTEQELHDAILNRLRATIDMAPKAKGCSTLEKTGCRCCRGSHLNCRRLVSNLSKEPAILLRRLLSKPRLVLVLSRPYSQHPMGAR